MGVLWFTKPLKHQTKIVAHNIFIFYFLSFEEIKAWFFMWILCLAEDSLETSCLIFSEKQWKNIYECRLLQSRLDFKGLNGYNKIIHLAVTQTVTKFCVFMFYLLNFLNFRYLIPVFTSW